MFTNNWKKEIFSIPNLLSFFRLFLIPVYVTIYLNATEDSHYLIAGMILAVSCITDMIDGKIARHFNMITNVGKILDPMADKATQCALTVCLSLKYPVMIPVLVLFLSKEFFQLFAAIINYRKGKVLSGALFAGKVCTTVLFVSLTLLVLVPNMDPGIVQIIALTDLIALTVAFIQYIFAFFGKNAKVKDIDK